MTDTSLPTDASLDRAAATPDPWPAARRIEEWAGEIRVNRIRLIAIAVFYARHLVDVYVRHDPAQTGRYHLAVTGVVVAWAVAAVVLHQFLLRRRVPAGLKFFSTAVDLLMLTLIGMIAGGPTKTPLVLLYFVIVACAPLRLSLPLVRFATLGAMACYLLLCAYYAWVLIGWDKYYATPELRIPRATEAIMVLSLGAAGLLAGQVVRQMRRLVVGYPVTVAAASPTEAGGQ
jgi:hypothetical protein